MLGYKIKWQPNHKYTHTYTQTLNYSHMAVMLLWNFNNPTISQQLAIEIKFVKMQPKIYNNNNNEYI